VEHYQSEQEQVEQLKRWWKDNGRALLAGLVLGLGGLAGYRYWDATQTARAENASINFEHLLVLALKQGGDDAAAAGRTVIDAYPGTPYARLSTLLLARLAVDAGDYATAKSHLETLLADAAGGEIANIARARLARILLAEGAVDEAARLLDAIPARDGRQRFPELAGDVAAARGDAQTARSRYLEALAEVDELGLDRTPVQLKLDNLSFAGAGDAP
jgi:predicted negative regulator of RcsB-dependent stress response